MTDLDALTMKLNTQITMTIVKESLMMRTLKIVVMIQKLMLILLLLEIVIVEMRK